MYNQFGMTIHAKRPICGEFRELVRLKWIINGDNENNDCREGSVVSADSREPVDYKGIQHIDTHTQVDG